MATHISDETNIAKIEHKSKKNIALGTIFGYVAIFVSVAYGIFLTPEIIKTVGDTEYGLYGLSSSIINIFLLDFGLSVTIDVYLTKLRAKGDKEGVQKFLSSIFKIYLFIDIFFIAVIAILVFLAPYLFANTYGNPDNPGLFELTPQIRTLQYLFIIVGGYTIISLPTSCFNGVISTYEKFSFIKLMDLLQKVLYLVFTILSIQLKWQVGGSGIVPIVIINVCSAIFAIFLRYIYMIFYLGVKLDLRLGITKEEKKGVFKFSAWGFVGSICGRLAFNITPFILSIVSSDTAVTAFSLVATLELYIFTFGELFSSFFMAKVARTANGDDSDEAKAARIQSLSEKIGKLQLIITGALVFGFISVGQEFILFWLDDPKYLIIYWCVFAICCSEVFRMPTSVLDAALLNRGYVKLGALIVLAKAIVNLGLSFLLSYLFTRWYPNMYFGAGALGASIAVLCGRVVYIVLKQLAFKKYLKISLSHFYKKVFLRGAPALIMATVVGLGLHFLHFIPDHLHFVKFLFNGFAFVIVYFLGTLYITFDREEKSYYVGVLIELLHIDRLTVKYYSANLNHIKKSTIKKAEYRINHLINKAEHIIEKQ